MAILIINIRRFFKNGLTIVLVFSLLPFYLPAHNINNHIAPKPLFSDPVIMVPPTLWSSGIKDKKCWMFYNNRRANAGHAYLLYFTHPVRSPDDTAAHNFLDMRRSVIQVVELKYKMMEQLPVIVMTGYILI